MILDERLSVDKLIPCNCEKCLELVKIGKKPHFYRHESLLQRKIHGKQTVECDISYQDVSVRGLLDAVFVEEVDERGHGAFEEEMDSFYTPQKIELLIKQIRAGKVKEVLDQLEDFGVPRYLEEQFMGLQGRFHRLQGEIGKGTLDGQEALKEMNRIAVAIQQFVGELG